jgi:glutamyl-Q tRNA(Asp) synthetase
LRIEDVDIPRSVAGADRLIMNQLTALGLRWDGEVVWQSQRDLHYQSAANALMAAGLLYGCGCTRREIAQAAQAANVFGDAHETPYLGRCRAGLPPGRTARAWRVRIPEGVERFDDRWLGPQAQDVARQAGDVVLRRAGGLWAYQLAVVVDDALQHVTAVLRGADLLLSTGRQRVLGRLLGLRLPSMMHVPLVLDPVTGLKLSKRNHAPALQTRQPVLALNVAWRALGFDTLPARDADDFLARATLAWAQRFAPVGISSQTLVGGLSGR